MSFHRALRRAGVVTGAVAVLALPAAASADLQEINTKKLRNAVTVNGILQHERALQAIANMNGGTRASGTPGYRASLDYVKSRLENAGYDVTEQSFTFPFWRDLAAPTVSQISPTPATYGTATLTYSGSGDVTGRLVPVNDNQIPPPATLGSADEKWARGEPSAALSLRGVAVAQSLWRLEFCRAWVPWAGASAEASGRWPRVGGSSEPGGLGPVTPLRA